jgi:hypothetical protein
MPEKISWYGNRPTEESWFNIQQRQKVLLFFKVSRLTFESTQYLIQYLPGGALSPGLEQLEAGSLPLIPI